MDRDWTQFIESGCSGHVLGLRSKIFVLPAPGQQAPDQITLIQCYMKFHCRCTSVSRIMSHATITNFDKVFEVTMANSSTPPRKFTTLCHEYMDLRTPKDLKVFHAVIPRVETTTRGASVDCLYLAGNHMAKDMAAKIAVCPSAWWWHLFQFWGYNERMAQSLMDSFKMDAAYVADQSMFNRETGTITTQFANADDFLDRIEHELRSEDKDNTSVDSVGGTPKS
jgi:hypothetical protein